MTVTLRVGVNQHAALRSVQRGKFVPPTGQKLKEKNKVVVFAKLGL